MENENNPRRFESVFSSKVKAGKRRTYFFDVRRTKGDDFYITLTESTKKFDDDGYERHKIFLYKEDFNRFVEALGEVVNHVKTELMPDYDYDEYTRRQEEWERKRDAGELESYDKPVTSDKTPDKDASQNTDPVVDQKTDPVTDQETDQPVVQETDQAVDQDTDQVADQETDEGHAHKDSDDMSW